MFLFVGAKQIGQGHPVSTAIHAGVTGCGGEIFRDRESRNDVQGEKRKRWRQGERGEAWKRHMKKRTDRQREGLSLGLQTTVLFFRDGALCAGPGGGWV